MSWRCKNAESFEEANGSNVANLLPAGARSDAAVVARMRAALVADSPTAAPLALLRLAHRTGREDAPQALLDGWQDRPPAMATALAAVQECLALERPAWAAALLPACSSLAAAGGNDVAERAANIADRFFLAGWERELQLAYTQPGSTLGQLELLNSAVVKSAIGWGRGEWLAHLMAELRGSAFTLSANDVDAVCAAAANNTFSFLDFFGYPAADEATKRGISDAAAAWLEAAGRPSLSAKQQSAVRTQVLTAALRHGLQLLPQRLAAVFDAAATADDWPAALLAFEAALIGGRVPPVQLIRSLMSIVQPVSSLSDAITDAVSSSGSSSSGSEAAASAGATQPPGISYADVLQRARQRAIGDTAPALLSALLEGCCYEGNAHLALQLAELSRSLALPLTGSAVSDCILLLRRTYSPSAAVDVYERHIAAHGATSAASLPAPAALKRDALLATVEAYCELAAAQQQERALQQAAALAGALTSAADRKAAAQALAAAIPQARLQALTADVAAVALRLTVQAAEPAATASLYALLKRVRADAAVAAVSGLSSSDFVALAAQLCAAGQLDVALALLQADGQQAPARLSEDGWQTVLEAAIAAPGTSAASQQALRALSLNRCPCSRLYLLCGSQQLTAGDWDGAAALLQLWLAALPPAEREPGGVSALAAAFLERCAECVDTPSVTSLLLQGADSHKQQTATTSVLLQAAAAAYDRLGAGRQPPAASHELVIAALAAAGRHSEVLQAVQALPALNKPPRLPVIDLMLLAAVETENYRQGSLTAATLLCSCHRKRDV